MSDWFLGEIRLFPINWAPDGWHVCDGSTMQIQQNQALFSLLGTTYGGNGSTTFNLPDLRGRTIVHENTRDASGQYLRGKAGGSEGVALTLTQIPPHQHLLAGTAAPGAAASPINNYFASYATTATSTINLYARPGSTPAQLNPATLGQTGSGAAHNNMQPYLVLNYCIAVQGIYPPRN